MPEAFKKALDSSPDAPTERKPVVIDAKVDVPGLGLVDVTYEPQVRFKDERKKGSKRTEFFKRIASRPIKGEFTGENRESRRSRVGMGYNTCGVLKGHANPAQVIKRTTDGKRVRCTPGTFGRREPAKVQTVYAENEMGLTPQDLERKRAYLAARASAKAPAKVRKARTKKATV